MPHPLRILILEDVAADAELAKFELTRALGDCTYLEVDTRDGFIRALEDFVPNLVISDYRLPTFDGLSALRLAQKIIPDVPFIILTGSMNEDTAVECMKAGSWDYVIKEHVKRLGSAAKSALELRQARAERRRAEVSLRYSEQRLQVAQRLVHVGHWEFDLETQKIHWSDSVYAIYARDPKLGPPSLEEEATYYSPDTMRELRRLATRAIETGTPFEFASTLKRADGTVVDFTTIGSTMTDDSGRVVRLIGTVQDVTERNRSEARVRHLNSILDAIRNINKLIIRERDPDRLIQQACELLVNQRGFRGAWVLLTDATGRRTAWALAGLEADSESMLTWLNAGAELPCLKESRARDASVFVIETAVSCLTCPLAQRESHAFSVITPLIHGNINLGFLGVSFQPTLTIDEEEKSILSEFAADLAYALRDIELEKQRDRFAQIVTNSQEAMALIGPDFTYLDANDAYRQLVGSITNNFIGTAISTQIDEAYFVREIKPNLERCFSGEKVEFESEIILPSGLKKNVSAIYSPCFLPDGTVSATAVCIRDITVQKQSTLALVESEWKYRLLSDNAGVGIGYYALDGTLLFFNSKAANSMNGPVESFVGKSLVELYGDELADLILCRIEEAATTQVPHTYEDKVHLSSVPNWFLSTYTAITESSGQVVGVQIISNDITAKKQSELSLQIERDNLATFLAAAPAAILVLDHRQRLVHCNLAAEQLIESSLSNTFGKCCGDLLNCAHHLEGPHGCGTGFSCSTCPLFEIIRETLGRRLSVHGREIALEIAGKPVRKLRWFVANSGPLTLESGPGAVLALHDVTERKQAEEKLRFQALLLKSQNEASLDGILIDDPHGKLLWHNQRFTEIFQISQNSLQYGLDGATMAPLIDRLENAGEYQEKLLTSLRDRNTKSRDELRLKDGRTLDHFGGPILGEAGEYLGRVWLFRDITNEKQLRASIAQSDRLASMGMLAAGVAHEINNPLSYILYNLESLAEDLLLQATQVTQLRATILQFVDINTQAQLFEAAPNLVDPALLTDMEARFRDTLVGTRRIKEIAKGLGTFSRVERERIAPISISGPLESALSIAFNEIKYRARIEKAFESSSLVLASDGQLSQVFLNLLINAAHSIKDGNVDGNRISIRTWERDGEVFASIEDTGCGIPEENLERIFDPFFTTKPIGIGSGLGLNIVRNIITGYSGTIHVTSKLGKGTLFVVRLPMATVVKPASEFPRLSAKDFIGPRGRILLVDDEPPVRAVLTRILVGHEVIQVESGEEAFALLSKDQRFDVILCDIMMPKMSGIDLHRWLVESHPRLARRVVFVTGGAFTANTTTYLEQVPNQSLEKPFDGAVLKKLVFDWVTSAQKEDATK